MRKFILAFLVLTIISGCSHGNPALISSETEIINLIGYVPILATDNISTTGILGVYNLRVSSDSLSGELIPMRSVQIGESWLLNGKSFFISQPCAECLRVKNLGLDIDRNLVVKFEIKHPFSKGNVNNPPSAKNRLDLDLFDVALIFDAHDILPVSFPQTGVEVKANVLNADGYTNELSNLTGDDIVLPYKICYESSNNNRFEMETGYTEFEISLLPFGEMSFNLFLTMGYGSSASLENRLNPTYYIPEFNRKPPWKIDVHAQAWYKDSLSTVTVDVFDWNHGATVASSFPDPANPGHISAPSDIASVTIDVPGMLDSSIEAHTTDTSFNGWDDPVTYTASFRNENNLPRGNYPGLVKVTDSRIPSTVVYGGEIDSLINIPDGKTIEFFNIDEFATYQVFTAEIDKVLQTLWVNTWGGQMTDVCLKSCLDNSGNICSTGFFYGLTDFDPSGSHYLQQGNEVYPWAYVNKVSPDGEFIWAQTWGGSGEDGIGGLDIQVDSQDNVYVTGRFTGTVDFDPGPGIDERTSGVERFQVFLSKFDANGNFIWCRTFGDSQYWNRGRISLVIDSQDNIYVSGDFSENVDFDPGLGIDEHQSNGSDDIFLIKFDSEGNYIWGNTWGGPSADYSRDINYDGSDCIYITGNFKNTVDFDPGPGIDEHTVTGTKDLFLSKINADGNFVWAKTWGGSDSMLEAFQVISNEQNIYIPGYYSESVDFDPGTGVYQCQSLGEWDAFLLCFSETGAFNWVKTWGSDNIDLCAGIAMDQAGNFYTIGLCLKGVDLDPGTGIDYHIESGMFISKFNNQGDYQWARIWADLSISSNYVTCLITDNPDYLYLTGTFGFADFDPEISEMIRYSSGLLDSYILKLESLF
jgi:hypothetical protein